MADVTERWAKPITVHSIQVDEAVIVDDGDGQKRLDVELSIDPESAERIKTGWVCSECYEPQSEAFPEVCSLCGFPMREWGAADAAIRVNGERVFSKRAHLEAAVNRMVEEEQRANHQKRAGIQVAKSIPKVVPRDAREAVRGLLFDLD